MGVFTSTRLTTDCSPRTATANMAVLHHAALTGAIEVLVGMMMPGGRTVSAHAAIKDGQIVHTVPLDKRAWSLGDAYWDSRAFTCECVNQSANGWTLSAATHESIARFVAAMAKQHGFYPHRSGDPRTWTVLGHREVYTIHGGSYATACPGGMDLAWITKRAQQILGDDVQLADIVDTAAPTGTWAGYKITTIQELLTKAGFPTEVDGIYGPDTTAKVKAFQKARGLVVDGDVGPKTWAALNGTPAPATIPRPAASAALVVDGIWGPLTTKELQRDLGVNPDGIIGPITATALQKRLGVTPDGIIGPITRKALQKLLGVKQDGIWGPETTKALQRRLNGGNL